MPILDFDPKIIAFEKIYQFNKQINDIIGSSFIISQDVNESNLHYMTLPSIHAISESLWKYNTNHIIDNTFHAIFRLVYHMEKLKLKPYFHPMCVFYFKQNIFKLFPIGCMMPDTLYELNITQEYIDLEYSEWNIELLPEYNGRFNNDLMYDINPKNDNLISLYQVPFCLQFITLIN